MVPVGRLVVDTTGFTALTTNLRALETVAPALTALTVTVKVPDFVGVPVIRPEAYRSPLGSPVTVTVGVGFPVATMAAV